MEKYCISVDWLSVYCLNKHFHYNVDGDYRRGRVMEYFVREEQYSTSMWEKVYTVFSGSYEVATMTANPRSKIMSGAAVVLKLHNRILYSARFIEILRDLIDVLCLEYKGVTRLDLCYDCNYIHGGTSPSKFLMDYMFHPPFCEGHIIRSGSRKVNIVGTRSGNGSTEITAMRWGSHQSDVGAYCYNKSLELLEVHDKPWIRAVWEREGLKHTIDTNEWEKLSEAKKKDAIKRGDAAIYLNQSVWRFEVSIKGHGKDLLSLDTGELFKLDLSYLATQERIEELFYMYAAKVFDFRCSSGQKTIREYPPLQVFEKEREPICKPIRINLYADTGRTEKMCANRLKKLQQTYSDLTSVDLMAIESAIVFLREIAGDKRNVIRLEKESRYLEHIQSFKWKGDERKLYFETLNMAHKKRMDISAEKVYDYFESLSDVIAHEENLASLLLYNTPTSEARERLER